VKQFVLKHPVAIMVSAAVITVTAFLLVMTLQRRFTDSDLVYCLSDQHRSELVDAAVALSLAQRTDTDDRLRVDNQEITPEQWRSTDREAFERGCLALNPPEQRLNPFEQIVSAESGLAGVLGVLVGGAIYYFSDQTRYRAQRRGDEARRLNDLGTAFRAAVENYVQERSAAIPPEHFDVDQIRAHRNELISELQLLRIRRPGWDAPNAPLTILRGALSDQLMGDWHDPNRRAIELIDASNQLAEQISSIAVELERGGPSSTAASR
jgi:hypothetical protein